MTLRLSVTTDALDLEVVNPFHATASAQRVHRAGRGLNGMRERVTLLRGRLDVEQTGGTWRVTARLPLHDPESAP